VNTTAELKQFACELAAGAGEVLRQAFYAPAAYQQERRSPKNMHLLEDRTIDQWLVKRIQERYPQHTILTEESGEHAPLESDAAADAVVRWIVDPVDGSANFASHNPFVAISLAVEIDGVLTLGVIEAPMLDEQFVAVKGCGATVNGRTLQVSTTNSLADAYLVSCDGGMEDRTQVFSTLVRNYYDQVKDFRKLGSAALECAWVAAGRADAYITMAIDPWDVAAGVLLVEEAGGRVTTLQGEAWKPTQTDLLCSNNLLHQTILDRVW